MHSRSGKFEVRYLLYSIRTLGIDLVIHGGNNGASFVELENSIKLLFHDSCLQVLLRLKLDRVFFRPTNEVEAIVVFGVFECSLGASGIANGIEPVLAIRLLIPKAI